MRRYSSSPVFSGEERSLASLDFSGLLPLPLLPLSDSSMHSALGAEDGLPLLVCLMWGRGRPS